MHGATAIALVGAASLLGAAIRLAVTRGLSLDEIRTVDQVVHRSFGALISHLPHAGVQPPLHPVLEWCMVRLLGDTSFAVRLPSLVAGVALIPVAAWLAAELFDRRTAVVAALLASVAPALVWYSQEASGYMLVALFGTLAVLGAVRAARRGRPGDWVLHAVAAALAVWAGWSGIFIVLATELALLVETVRRRRTRAPLRGFLGGWALDTVALACQLAPLALLFVKQLHSGGGLTGVAGVAASGVSFYTTVSNVSWGLFGFHPATVTGVLSALWPLAMLASLLMIGRGVGRRAWLLLLCAVVPGVAVLALGLAVPGAFDIRYALASVPLILVLIARIATAWPRSRLGRILIAGVALAILVGSLVDQQIDRNNPRRYDYASALAQVRRDSATGDAVFLEPGDLRVVAAREAPGLRTAPLTTSLPKRAQARSVFLVASFAHQPALLALLDRELGALRATRHLVGFHSYPGVDVWWFR